MTATDLLDRYAALLLDAWGVLVTAGGAVPGAVGLVARLLAEDRRFAVVTNTSSRSPEATAAHLATHGMPIPVERIVSPLMLLPERIAAAGLRGAPVVVLGPEDPVAAVREAGAVPVAPSPEVQAVIVCDESGFPFVPTVDAVVEAVERRVRAGRPVRLWLANPDLVYPRGPDTVGMGSGAVALVLQAMLDARLGVRAPRLEPLGKPAPDLVHAACARLGTRDAVLIGDQLGTDVTAAHAAGIDAALVATGLTRVDGVAVWDPAPRWLLRDLEA